MTVYAPQFVSNKHIQEWLFDKQVWVNDQLTKQHNIADSRQNPLKDKQILIFDSIENIEFKQGTKSEVINSNDSLLITLLHALKILRKNISNFLKNI
ncbi:DUF45 domain-containing protein [Pseudoalteromonas sp. B193]